MMPLTEAEWQTRKRRIDPKLDAAGWTMPEGRARPIHQPFRFEEEDTMRTATHTLQQKREH
jgi:hypothetical protein